MSPWLLRLLLMLSVYKVVRLQTHVSLIISLRRHFKAGCVFFSTGNSTGLDNRALYFEVQRILAQEGIPSQAIAPEDKGRVECRISPLFVLTVDDVNRFRGFGNTTILNDNSNRQMRGGVREIWNALEQQMNFTTNFIEPPDGAWGRRHGNGSWTGMIGQVQRGEVEVAVGMFTMTTERAATVHFSLPVHETKILAFLREPRFDDFNWNSFLAPLSSSLWQATGVCTFVLAATLAGIYYFSWRNGDESAQGVYSFSFRDSLFYMFTSLTQQGHDVTPSSSSGRVVYLLGYVVAVIVMTAYSAALVSFLTAQVKELPFRDLNGLLADGTYKLGVVATAADFNMFSESKNSLMQQLYEKLMKPDTQNLAATVEEAASRLCRTKFVLVVSAEFPGNVLQISNCSVASLPDVSFKNIMSLALAPGSPYLGLINHILLNMRNSGILRQMSMKSPFQLQDTKETSLRSVHLENVVPIFTILACGIGIGLLLLAVEMTQNRLFHRLQVTSGTRDRSLFRSSPFRWNLLQRSRQETFLPPNTRGKNQSKGISVQTKKAFEGVEGKGFL